MPTQPPTTSPPKPTTTPSPHTPEARAAFTASLTSASHHLSSTLTTRATDLHANTHAIAKQEADLKAQTGALEKESRRFQKEVEGARGKLKELGDIQNWAEVLERDLLVVEEAVRMGEEEEGREGKGGGRMGGGRENGWH